MATLPPRLDSPSSARTAGSCHGLYPASDFVVGDAEHTDGVTFRQVRWYFRHEIVALPKAGVPTVGLQKGQAPFAELAAWRARPHGGGLDTYPPLVWVAAPDVVPHARIDPEGGRLLAPDGWWRMELVPRLPTNTAFFDARTAAWFAQRPVRVRGTAGEHVISIRTLWPKDFRLPRDTRRVGADPVPDTPAALRQALRREPNGGAASPFAASLLWARDPGAYAVPTGRAVFGLVVNGAQGDDDEAHGGHFALVTGRTSADGSIADWLVNNFYSLDQESEKGILPAPVPLDNYLADLNSGQAYYRPSAMLVAVLREDRAAVLLQSALNRIFAQFYRHQLVYHHGAMNCAGISVDVLRTLGFPVPARGAAAPVRAALGLPWLLARERSVRKAAAIYDYLAEDQTRLLPAAAFEEVGAALLREVRTRAPIEPHGFAELLAADTEAILLLRFPQIPSGRALGHAPVATPFEFRERLPKDPAHAQIIPLQARPFPHELRDDDLLPPPAPRSERALRAWAAATLIGLPWAAWRMLRRDSGGRRVRAP